MARKIQIAIEAIQRKQVRRPCQRVQVFAAVLTALEELYPGDQEFVWRQIGSWKKFRTEAQG